tara:strand:+ start:7340 stop:7456 length:117 start_codon:yes stop_codon:yes gene_type:complete
MLVTKKPPGKWIVENIFEVNGYPSKEVWQARLEEWGIK